MIPPGRASPALAPHSTSARNSLPVPSCPCPSRPRPPQRFTLRASRLDNPTSSPPIAFPTRKKKPRGGLGQVQPLLPPASTRCTNSCHNAASRLPLDRCPEAGVSLRLQALSHPELAVPPPLAGPMDRFLGQGLRIRSLMEDYGGVLYYDPDYAGVAAFARDRYRQPPLPLLPISAFPLTALVLLPQSLEQQSSI